VRGTVASSEVRRIRRVFAAAATVALVAVGPLGCRSSSSTDAEGAKNCTELVDRASTVAKQVLQSVAGKSLDDLEAENSAEPFAPLTKPFEPFAARATVLGCDGAELRRVACDAYQDLQAKGPVAEEFLSTVIDTCR
jgi:hypothetical protein